MRVTTDTNILVSALIAKGKPRKLIKRAEDGKFKLILTDSIIDEFHDVVQRKKFRKYATIKDAKDFIRETKKISEMVNVESNFQVIKEDPDDNMILNAAYDGKADYIVTGDHDLLGLKEFEGIGIVTVDKMLRILKSLE